jgi:positive regulator of sigma E activity
MSAALPPTNPNAPLPGAAAHINRRELITIVWVTIGIAGAFVCLRLYARLRETRKLLADDYCE